MARLKHRATGVTVNVSDDKAKLLGTTNYEAAEKPAPKAASKSEK